MSYRPPKNRREHIEALHAAARAHGVEIVPSGSAWRVRGVGVDILCSDLALVHPRDLAPAGEPFTAAHGAR